MAIIIETCPKCGHDLTNLILTTYPPIPQKKCFNCGWEWTGEREEIVRVPFGGNNLEMSNNDSYLNNFLKTDFSEEELKINTDSTITLINLDGTATISGFISTDNCINVEETKNGWI